MQQLDLRGTGTKNKKRRLDNTKKRGNYFLIWPVFERNFNLQMVKSFNFLTFIILYDLS